MTILLSGCYKSFMLICNSFLAIHKSVLNWSLFLYHERGWGKQVWYSDVIPKTLAGSLLLLLLYCLWKYQRNTDSPGLCTSHLKFESDFSKEIIFEAEQVHSSSSNVMHQKLWHQVWIENFLDLFNLGHFPE